MIRTLLLVPFLSGCAGWFPVAVFDHLSNPSKGGCENTSDYAGFGAGWRQDRSAIYVTLGAKAEEVCDPVRGGAHTNLSEPGGQLLMIHEFRKGRR